MQLQETLFEQSLVIKSYLHNIEYLCEDDFLDSSLFANIYKPLVCEFNKRLELDKEVLVSLYDEYMLIEHNSYIESINVLSYSLAKKWYRKLSTKSVALNLVSPKCKKGLSPNFDVYGLYEKIILSSYYYKKVKEPFKLDEVLFSGFNTKVANSINRLIDRGELYKFDIILNCFGAKTPQVQDCILEIMATESVSNAQFYYNKLIKKGVIV